MADEDLMAKALAVHQVGAEERLSSLNWEDVWRTFFEAKCWFTAVIYFSLSHDAPH